MQLNIANSRVGVELYKDQFVYHNRKFVKKAAHFDYFYRVSLSIVILWLSVYLMSHRVRNAAENSTITNLFVAYLLY